MHGQDKQPGSDDPSAITRFAAKVSRYFLDFLETDFKRQQAPRRKIQLKNDTGFRTGLPPEKVPQSLPGGLEDPFNTRWRAPVAQNLQESPYRPNQSYAP